MLNFLQRRRYTRSGFSTSMIFPISEKATEQVKNLIAVFQNEHSRNDLMDLLGLTHREHFRTEYLQRAIDLGLVEPTTPSKPKSSKQKYRLTEKGKQIG